MSRGARRQRSRGAREPRCVGLNNTVYLSLTVHLWLEMRKLEHSVTYTVCGREIGWKDRPTPRACEIGGVGQHL